ncbi:MAG TPA: vitamin K epoxide reductase family protein, partial [Vicinamibacterales bacterium]|nr:vitamin K epoxide reductase family protein [Vicinamibacterales bacterium]
MSPQPTSVTAPRTLWFAIFAAIGLIASSTSTWVHYRILNDPTYASFCDVNESFSCTVAYTSQFGSVAGVPVAVFGVVFFAFALLLIAMCARSSAAENLPGYLFAASTIGLAVVLYLGYASFFILKTLCVLCLATYVAVVGLFITAGTATRNPMTNLPSRAMRDLQLLFRTPSA